MEKNGVKVRFNCPSCGASIQQDPNRNSMYCTFCGQPIIDVRGIIEKQAALDVRKQEMEAIRDHKAQMHEMEMEHQKEISKAKAINTLKKTLTKILVPVLVLLAIIVGYRIMRNTYKLVGTTAYTKQAFSVTKDQLLKDFLAMDTKSSSQYKLENTGWKTYSDDENFFTEKYKKVYNGERRYLCYFYKPEKANANPPTKYKDDRMYYYIYVQTDENDRIIYCNLWVNLRDETKSKDKALNGYFGSTLPGEIFSIVAKRDGNHVLGRFKKAEDAWLIDYYNDGDVRFYYETSSDDVEYTMLVTYKD